MDYVDFQNNWNENASFTFVITETLPDDLDGTGFVHLSGGRVSAVAIGHVPPEGSEGATVLDATGCWVVPGLLDLRANLREPGHEQAETIASLQYLYIIALIIIYALLAIPFNSYIQPIIVMAAIPFGLIGAVWGHVVMGMDVTILSGFGVVALTGVVVNDSLVMVDYVNRKRGIGLSEMESARQAGLSRFRPILLTSLTTFAGLTPLLLEKSLQAKFLVPMGISLGFGVIFATVITLILVPAMYLILEDIRTLLFGPEDKL